MEPSRRSAEGARTLPREYYVSSDVFERERRTIFQRQWLCVGRASEVPGPGRYMLVDVEGESLIVTRDEQSQLRGFFNVCRHRGTRLCAEGGTEPLRAIRCPYHAWTYDLRGRLVAAPNMRGVVGFDAADYPLHGVAVAEWQGFLMVNLSPDPPSIADWSAPWKDRLQAWQIDQLQPAARLEYSVAANWKLLFQNYSECYHCPTVHPALNALTPFKLAENDFERGAILGGPMPLADGVESMSEDGRACADPLPKLDRRQRRHVFYYTLFPSLFLSPHPDFVLVHRLARLGVNRTRVVCEFLYRPEVIERAAFDPQSSVRFWDQTNRQDWHVCELSQQGIASLAYQPGPYADLESVVAAFDQHYLEVMNGRG
jgi:Rieske 2Fe-2S family protein